MNNNFNKKINVVQSDRDSECVSPFTMFYVEHEIRHEIIAPYTPHVVEKKNWTLKKMMNTFLLNSELLKNLWGKAIIIANYFLNKVLCKKIKKNHYELWNGRKLFYKYLRVWGCLATD